MKKILSALLAASLLISATGFGQQSMSEKLQFKERIDAFMNPPTKQERKEELTRLEKALMSVKAKYRRVMNCLAGKQACNKSDFAILGMTTLFLYSLVLGIRQGAREELADESTTKDWSTAQKLARKAYIFSTDYDPVRLGGTKGLALYEWFSSLMDEDE